MLFIVSTPVLIRHLWNVKTVFPALVSNMCCSIEKHTNLSLLGINVHSKACLYSPPGDFFLLLIF